jgi:hypothetical protein
MLSLLLSALLLLPAAQPDAGQPCVVDAGLQGSLAAWRTPVAAPATLVPGQAVRTATATPLTLEIAEAGTYVVALDIPAWVDLSRDGQTLRSAAHDHGPDCSTIRKFVDFILVPGRYTITLSRTEVASAHLLVIRRY